MRRGSRVRWTDDSLVVPLNYLVLRRAWSPPNDSSVEKNDGTNDKTNVTGHFWIDSGWNVIRSCTPFWRIRNKLIGLPVTGCDVVCQRCNWLHWPAYPHAHTHQYSIALINVSMKEINVKIWRGEGRCTKTMLLDVYCLSLFKWNVANLWHATSNIHSFIH